MQQPSPPNKDDNTGSLETALQGMEAAQRHRRSSSLPTTSFADTVTPPSLVRATTTCLPTDNKPEQHNTNANDNESETEPHHSKKGRNLSGSRPSRITTGISLRDVMAHNPTEDACEAYIQQAIEQVAAETAVDVSVVQQQQQLQHPLGILTHVPDETVRSHDFEEAGIEAAAATTSTTTTEKNPRKSIITTTATTTAQTLTGLVAELQTLHGATAPTDNNTPVVVLGSGGALHSNSEAMVQAAVAMVQQPPTIPKRNSVTPTSREQEPQIQTEVLRGRSGLQLLHDDTTSPMGLTIVEEAINEVETSHRLGMEDPGACDTAAGDVPTNQVPDSDNDARSTTSSVGMVAMENGGSNTKGTDADPTDRRRHWLRRTHRMTSSAKVTATQDLYDVSDYFRTAQGSLRRTARNVLIVVLVLTGVAALLYYTGNPPCHGTNCRAPPPTLAPTEDVSSTSNTVQINTTAEDGTSVNIQVDTPTVIATEEETTSSDNSFFLGASSAFSSVPDALRYTAFSWWLLFLVRQIMTLMLARMTQGILVDICSVRTKLFLRLLGPFVTLFFVQAKGFPMITFFWGLYDFLLLWGGTKFAKHWLFWQNLAWLKMVRSWESTFEYTHCRHSSVDPQNTEANNVSSVTTNFYYTRILIIMIMLGALTAMKRFWFSLFLGRQTFRRYADELAKVIQNALYVGQVATLARDLELLSGRAAGDEQKEKIRALVTAVGEHNQKAATTTASNDESSILGDASKTTAQDNIFQGADMAEMQREKLEEILGAFEEPERVNASHQKVKISDIIRFRQSLAYLYTEYPFTAAFGACDTREACIQSSENVYRRLARNTATDMLHFETIALLGIRSDGSLNEEKLTALVRLFRPGRDGRLPLLDFAKSVDGVYKSLRTLRASVANSSRIDAAFENAINILLYFGLSFVIVAIMGVNPLVLFTSLAGVALSFNFMFSASCGKIFDGALLIFARKPYEIGDRIAISSPQSDAPSSGSAGWIVQDVNLLTTTIVYGSTSEVATISNGSIASSRIINCARSPKAFLHFTIKFPLETPYQQLKVKLACSTFGSSYFPSAGSSI